MKKCIETNADIHVALLWITAIPLEPILPNQDTLLFIYPI